MHNHSIDNCIIFKNKVNDPGLAFDGKVGLGPFWTLVQVSLQRRGARLRQLLRLLLPAHAYSYRRKDHTRMQMQDLIDDL
jgi:hypothetical protein